MLRAAAAAAIVLIGGGSGLLLSQPDSRHEQTLRILAIEDGRDPSSGDVRFLLDLASTGGSGASRDQLRTMAIRAVGRLSIPAAIPALIDLAHHSDAGVRDEAAFALALTLRSGRAPAGDANVQRGIEALLAMGAPPPPALAQLPYSRPEDVRAAERKLRSAIERVANPPAAPVRALEAIARLHRKLSPLEEDTIEALKRIATRQVPTDVPDPRRSALAALLAAGVADGELIEIVLGDGDDEVRRLGGLALSAGGTTVEPAQRYPLVRVLLEDRSALVRYEGVRAWARRESAEHGCGPLVEALRDESMHVVLAAMDALGDRCREDADVTDRVTIEARTPPTIGSWHREAHAFVALAKRSAERAELAMPAFAMHQVWQVRMYAARAALLLKDAATLERLASDSDHNVRDAALPALRALRGAASDSAFIAALGQTDYQLLRTAATGLKGAASSVREIRQALLDALTRVTKEKKDTSRDTRVALIERFGELATADAASSLEPFARDFDPAVASLAAATYRTLTGRSIEPRAVLQPRPPLPTRDELDENVGVRVRLDTGRTFDILFTRRPFHLTPLAYTRFIRLVRARYYDGLTFHRVVPNFIVQGGSPGANEYAGDGPFMRDELSRLGHERGTVGISTRGRDTGDAQIFINLVDNARLDADYTILGRIREMDAVDAIQEGTRILQMTIVRRPS